MADVSAYGNYAYLTSFRTDDCLGGGACVVDMTDPGNPVEDEFLPTTPGNYAGEGSQVITAEYGPYAGRQLFLHQNETCDAALAASAKAAPNVGGINIWDVTDPENRELLVEHAGDMTPNRTSPTSVTLGVRVELPRRREGLCGPGRQRGEGRRRHHRPHEPGDSQRLTRPHR